MIRQLGSSCSHYAKRNRPNRASRRCPPSRRWEVPTTTSLSTSSSHQLSYSPSVRNNYFVQQRYFATVQHDLPSDEALDESKLSSKSVTSRRELLLESFSRETLNNVNHVITCLDRKQTKKGRKINLSKRWQKSIRIEKQRYARRHGARNQQQLSVEDMWAEALEASNIPFLESENAVSEDMEILSADNGDADVLSPIFGLELDDKGRLSEFESLTAADEEKDEPAIDIESILDEGRINRFIGKGKDLQIDAALRAVALLSATNVDEWDVYDSRQSSEENEEGESTLQDTMNGDESELSTSDGIHELLEDMESGEYILTTSESNLLLSRLVTSTDATVDDILNDVLHLFEQVTFLGNTGIEDSGPDSITYRILLMALSRRLMATGEALKVAKELFDSNVELTPEMFLDCMEICFARNDIDSANEMLNTALERDVSFRPPVNSYIRMIDMMKSKNLQESALKLLRRAQEMNTLSVRDEGKLLLSLCNWPIRSRRGDLIDTAPLLLKLLDALESRSQGQEKPEPYVWTKLIGKIARQAKSYGSHWKDVSRALHTFFSLYPSAVPSPPLLKMCLDVGESIGDASIVDLVINKEVERQSQLISFTQENPLAEETSWDLMSDKTDSEATKEYSSPQVASIPQGVFRRGLQVCLRCGDAESANSILHSFDAVKEAYPMKVQSEIFGLALLCHTRARQAENAKSTLLTMIEQNMEPSEDLHGAVLYSLVVEGRFPEAMNLFEEMGQDGAVMKIEPGVSCFNAILLAHVRSQSWEKALSFYQTMVEMQISPSPQTVQSLILASYKTGGKPNVMSLLETLLAGEARVDERTFLLAARVFLPEANGTTDDIRKQLRGMGEANESLKRPTLDLTRSLRMAQVEQYRRDSKDEEASANRQQGVGEEAWQSALAYLLTLVRVLPSSSS